MNEAILYPEKHNPHFFDPSYKPDHIYICAFLTNFQPVLIPLQDGTDDDIESYFEQLSDSEYDDTDCSDSEVESG